jgi:hypothetical protein
MAALIIGQRGDGAIRSSGPWRPYLPHLTRSSKSALSGMTRGGELAILLNLRLCRRGPSRVLSEDSTGFPEHSQGVVVLDESAVNISFRTEGCGVF